jgi:hypothetical protein
MEPAERQELAATSSGALRSWSCDETGAVDHIVVARRQGEWAWQASIRLGLLAIAPFIFALMAMVTWIGAQAAYRVLRWVAQGFRAAP